jgi:PHD/YefM family antitoxin component YafN of YafNO toxin-antitoxin module
MAKKKTSTAESTYSISEIREVITKLPEQFDEDVKAVTVTRHGKDVMTILPSEAYKELLEMVDSLLETLEIVQDEELMEALRRGIKDMEEGRVISLDDAMKELGWA